MRPRWGSVQLAEWRLPKPVTRFWISFLTLEGSQLQDPVFRVLVVIEEWAVLVYCRDDL